MPGWTFQVFSYREFMVNIIYEIRREIVFFLSGYGTT